jgi:hypothetical protein
MNLMQKHQGHCVEHSQTYAKYQGDRCRGYFNTNADQAIYLQDEIKLRCMKIIIRLKKASAT